jgi:SAM-dependent methyltransferase
VRFLLESDFPKNAAFHDELAPRYDAHLANSECNILARRAFVELVTRCVSPGSSLLDFGCGTGIDAFQYARKGYRVRAYDNSPGMVAQLEQRCKAEIASGKITAWSEGYPSFLAHFPQSPAVSAVVADFAVLNSIGELEPLFDTFARRLAPPGWIVVSVLNPLHWSKLKTPRWWLKALWDRNGSPVYTTQPYVTYLHFMPALLRAARQFHLVGRANAGRCVRYDATMPGSEPRLWWGQTDSNRKAAVRAVWRTPAYRMLGHFVFLVLRRDP